MSRALDTGINFFDTADVYGQDGLSERIIGKFFEATRRRETWSSPPNSASPWEAARTRAARRATASCKPWKRASGACRTDRIDLYQIHMQDIDTPEEETLRALDDLVRAGKVLYIGASNYAGYRLAESQLTSEMRHLAHFVTLQAQYSLVSRDIEREYVPACARFGMGILPWSPLAGGFLSGKYRRGQAAPAGTRLDKWKERFSSLRPGAQLAHSGCRFDGGKRGGRHGTPGFPCLAPPQAVRDVRHFRRAFHLATRRQREGDVGDPE